MSYKPVHDKGRGCSDPYIEADRLAKQDLIETLEAHLAYTKHKCQEWEQEYCRLVTARDKIVKERDEAREYAEKYARKPGTCECCKGNPNAARSGCYCPPPPPWRKQ